MIIGLAGPKRSGKSFVASLLIDEITEEYQTLSKKQLNSLGSWGIRSFADPLRNFVLDVFNMDERHSEGYLKEVEVRSVLPTHEHIKSACQHYFNDTRPARLISSYLTVNQEAKGTIKKSYRSLMTYIGTEIIRDGICNDYWVDIANSEYKDKNVIFSDVRMPNEADWVRANGILVHVENPDVGYIGDHSTEKGLTQQYGDLIITNEPSRGHFIAQHQVKELKRKIEEIIL